MRNFAAKGVAVVLDHMQPTGERFCLHCGEHYTIQGGCKGRLFISLCLCAFGKLEHLQFNVVRHVVLVKRTKTNGLICPPTHVIVM
jgi:hypothetical protein